MRPWAIAGLIGLVAARSAAVAGGGEPESTAPQPGVRAPQIATFSIVARDPETGDYGVAVQSRYFAVGAVVPHAAAGTGAVATQARGNLLYGPQGLELLGRGASAADTLARLLAGDPLRDERQVGIVDRVGAAATYTGPKCLAWAGGKTGAGYAVQGNLLAGPQVVEAIAAAYETATGDFASRLVTAIEAGQAAGGDARGRQSAALLVARAQGGYLGLTDRYVDLHVEDHVTPIRELRRLLGIRQAQLASKQAHELLERARSASDATRSEQLAQAATAITRALELNPSDDYGWWLLAEIRLLQGQPDVAAAAARRALLVNPAWRNLSESNRAGLGVSPQLLAALLEVESFNRVWSSLAPQPGVIAQ